MLRWVRVSSLIELVGDDTRRLLDDQFPETLHETRTSHESTASRAVITASTSGVVTSIDRDELVTLVASAGPVSCTWFRPWAVSFRREPV